MHRNNDCDSTRKIPENFADAPPKSLFKPFTWNSCVTELYRRPWKNRRKTFWGFGIATISDGWINFASFPVQSDIQIKLEHSLFAMIQRQQELETRNHDDGNGYTQILPTRSRLGPVRKALYLEQGKKFPLNANPFLTETALDMWKEYIYKGKDFTRKFCKCNQFLHGKSLWNSRAESTGFTETGEECLAKPLHLNLCCNYTAH